MSKPKIEVFHNGEQFELYVNGHLIDRNPDFDDLMEILKPKEVAQSELFEKETNQ